MHEQVMVAVVSRNERPNRPPPEQETDITDELWQVWEDCWQADADARPEMSDVEKRMTRLCAAEKPLRLLSFGAPAFRDPGCSYLMEGGASADNGGVRIISALVSLQYIMDAIGPKAKPCEHFDMIAGSGTGG